MKKLNLPKISFKKISWRKLAIIGIAAAVLIGGGCAWYYVGHNSSDPVYVYPFEFVGMTEYWGDSRESYGPVSTDRIQTVFLSETQTVGEIKVKEGDTVKKGDLLMTFDTTLSDLAVERKRLEVEKLKLDIEDAKAELWRINSMKPMEEAPAIPAEPEDPNLGVPLSGYYAISNRRDYDGSTPDKALICWLNSGMTVSSALMEEIIGRAEELQNFNAMWAQYNAAAMTADGEAIAEGAGSGEEYVPFTIDYCYVIMKITEGNMSLGSALTWQGMLIYRTGVFQFFDALGMMDYTIENGNSEVDIPTIDYGSGFTAGEIAQMRAQQLKKIQELEFKQKMTDAEYKIMVSELSDGNVYAQTDGKVISVLTEDEAKSMQQPVLKVSGGGGFVIEGSVSELERDILQIGQEVTVSDWQSGMVYTGTVREIRDFPNNQSGGYGMGNPNASQYPYVVFVDDTADLREGTYVSVAYSPSAGQNGVYLEMPFLRTEQGRSYVYVMDANGRLEERTVTTGKSLWGSYVEVLDGLTRDDKIAFPYGKNIKPGVKVVEGDYSTLYGY